MKICFNPYLPRCFFGAQHWRHFPQGHPTTWLSASRNRSSGAALVFVLAALILVSVMLLGFFTSVTQDRAASASYESGSSAIQLADSAVGLVMAQIAEATAHPDRAWVSQPGLIRTFDSSEGVESFKLYSSDRMKEDGKFDPSVALAGGANIGPEVPPNWASTPDEFIDLNRPVYVDASPVFPIVDPGVQDLAELDSVEGFSVDEDAVPGGVTDVSPLPMPVRWIYVMADGSLASLAEATASGQDAVGRIAFWADDETCKVNLNTASGGVFYDSPAANTREDHLMGKYQPIAQEYQRFPGHPATTSLAAVLKPLRDDTDPVSRSRKAAQVTPRLAWGGSQGATQRAWWFKNLGALDSDRLFASIDELLFDRDAASGDWLKTSGTSEIRTEAGLAVNPKRLGFFVTTDSRAPDLNLLNRPRITLWPFNKELLADSASTPLLTPEDRLIRFASEVGQNKRKLYFQREFAWDPFHDYTAIPENQEIYSYLQWLTSQPVPGGSAIRAGTAAMASKYTALGRDQLLTQMFDYLRSTVNTINVSYQPVNGPTYSFPQGHDIQQSGFNDQLPLVIETGAGSTKGIGGPVLNEFVMQFYASGDIDGAVEEKPVYFSDASGNPITADPESAALNSTCLMVKKIRLVGLLDFWAVINNLNTYMPRFQVRIEGSSFGLQLSSVDANAGVKIRARGESSWSTSPAASPLASLGFPDSSGNVLMVVNNNAVFSMDRQTVFGGPLGTNYAMVAPTSNSTKTNFASSVVAFTKGKVLDRAAGYANYPFFSEEIEVGIPIHQVNGKWVEKDAAVAEPSLGFVGGAMHLYLYPLLSQGATNFSTPISATDGNFFQEIALQMPNTSIPFPKLGTNSKTCTDFGYMTAHYGLPKPTYAGMADYNKRLRYRDDLFLLPMTVPQLSSSTLDPANGNGGQMDVFRSVLLNGTDEARGDLRLVAARRSVPASWYSPSHAYANNLSGSYFGMTIMPNRAALTQPETLFLDASTSSPSVDTIRASTTRLVPNGVYHKDHYARVGSATLRGTPRVDATTGDVSAALVGDFTSAYGSLGDGALVKGPDTGAISRTDGDNQPSPYFSWQNSRGGIDDLAADGSANFVNFTGLVYSPWKQMPSAIAFGTLPSRALEATESPWETLLFNPVPDGGKQSHRGWAQLPRDHYWLDLFTMPAVEPYAITENLATDGKINLNQQIAPFTYIKRDTALHALLRDVQIFAIPNSASLAEYKPIKGKVALANAQSAAVSYRKPIDVAATVEQLRKRLDQNEPFVSASEICEIPMLPSNVNPGQIDAFWSQNKLTGDDKREMPYGMIYPRVTTRSNTYRVHFWSQTLKGRAGKWAVTGAYRGSQTIERYLDLKNRTYGASGASGSGEPPQFPALAGRDPVTNDSYYRFRVVDSRQFTP